MATLLQMQALMTYIMGKRDFINRLCSPADMDAAITEYNGRPNAPIVLTPLQRQNLLSMSVGNRLQQAGQVTDWIRGATVITFGCPIAYLRNDEQPDLDMAANVTWDPSENQAANILNQAFSEGPPYTNTKNQLQTLINQLDAEGNAAAIADVRQMLNSL